MSEKIFNPANIHKLEDTERLTWLPPQEVIHLLNLTAGMTVADIGTGSGFFALPFSDAVKPDGRVLAVDFQPEMLEFLGAKLSRAGAPVNVQMVGGEALATNLEDACCNLAFLGNVWHELDHHDRVLKEMSRILRPDGRLAILDWRPDVSNLPGPPANHRISATAVAASLETAAWTVTLSENVGRFGYLVIANFAHGDPSSASAA